MRIVTAALLALLLAATAHAQPTCATPPATPVWNTAVLNLSRPTQGLQNGVLVALPATVVITYKVYSGSTVLCTTTALVAALPNQVAGNQCWTATANANDTVANVIGESTKTSQVCKLIVAPPIVPGAPGLTVQPDPVAYEIRVTGTQLQAARLGRVELGTLCTQESQTVAGVRYNRVDIRAVDLVVWPSASPTTVKAFARCG